MANMYQDPTLAPLYSKPVFRSDVRVEAHEFVASEFADHVLRWKAGSPDAAMHKTVFNRISIYSLQYGPEVEVQARPFEDFALIHTSLRGGMEIDCDGRRIWTREGSTAVLAPKKSIHLRWSPKCRQMIFKIPRKLLDEIAKETGIGDVSLDPGILLPQALGHQWSLLVQSVLGSMSASGVSELSPQWTRHLERTVGTFILLNKPAQAIQPAEAEASICLERCNEKKTIDALVDYIDAHLCGPISLQDLTIATGLSVRAVNVLCQRFFGMTPMELVRNKRLDAVHRRLLLDPHASVTETALDFGFGHLGRFSAYYEARFKKLPRETQRLTREH